MFENTCRALLSECVSNRDDESWSEFDQRFRDCLIAGVRRAVRRSGRLVPPSELEDFVQEVYCRLLERDARVLRLCQAESERQAGAYLQTVSERIVLDLLRRRHAAKRGGALPPGEADAGPAESWVDTTRTTSPEELAIVEDQRRVFFAKCRRANGPDGARRDLYILYLALFEGCSSAEIVRRFRGALSTHAVDSRISRLRRHLRGEGVELPKRGRW